MAQLIEARDLRGKREARLIDAVPLSTPWTMFIDVCSACNYKCQYCPTGHPDLLKKHGRKPAIMRLDLFIKIVDEMKQFQTKLKMVNLYKDGEPLLNPHFSNMVRYLRAANVTEKIWVKTNGQLLEPKLNMELVSCGLDMIGVSVQAVNAQGFYDIAKARIDYEKYRDGVMDLYNRSRGTGTGVSVKIADVGLSEASRDKFLHDFGDRCDYIAIEGLHGWSTSEEFDYKLGTNNSFDGTPVIKKIVCPLVLYMLTVNSNGDISVCNDDQFHFHKLGNANNENIVDIWGGAKFREFRMMHLDGHRVENAACANCDYINALPDSVDDDREAIRERILNA